MPNFEVLDARIASALNKLIHNSHFKRRISLEEQKAQKQDRFLRGRQIAYLIYEYFRVIGANDSVENYADLFTISRRNDDIQEFDSKWDGILLSMTKIPLDDILEGLYKLRRRESEKLKTVLELYDSEIHQKKLGPDYHKLKTMVKRSIEQDTRNKNFGIRNGNYERNAVVKNQGTKQQAVCKRRQLQFMARRKLIEDQNTILELSGRVQELQNEVNCMSDSKDFQDAESIRSGNSHVTSRPVSFPPHPIPEGMLRHSFVSPSRKEGPPSIFGTHMVYRETFLQIHMHLHQLLILKNCINGIRQSRSRSIRPQWRKVKGKNKNKI